ncbi:MAG: helix-turn-helix domain-containing protein [Alphaproteobacteria bacterium]
MLSKPMLTVHEVAALLKIKEATVRVWLSSGQLPAAKFGKEWRVAEKDLNTFVEERMHKPDL